MKLIMEAGADRRRENLPTATEVAAVIPDIEPDWHKSTFRDMRLTVLRPVSGGLGLERVDPKAFRRRLTKSIRSRMHWFLSTIYESCSSRCHMLADWILVSSPLPSCQPEKIDTLHSLSLTVIS